MTEIWPEVVTELSLEECWTELRGQEFARLAYVLGDEPGLVPLNYAVDDSGPDAPSLLFRTAGGSKLLSPS